MLNLSLKNQLINVKDCNDINQNCEIWSQKGECQRNKQFMSIECKSSCNLCKETSTKTTLKAKTTTQTDLSGDKFELIRFF